MSCLLTNPKGCAGLLLALLFAAFFLYAQEPAEAPGQGTLLPATIGEPLTIAPVDLPDVDCSIQRWDAEAKMPVLTLLCPPEPVFSPLRVYLRLSWIRPEDVPGDVSKVVAKPKGLTRIRTNKNVLMVRLPLTEKQGQNSREKWVGFTGVVDVALIKEGQPRPR